MLAYLCFFILPIVGVHQLLRWVRTLPMAKHLKETNDIAGFYITVIGAMYAVVLAFMMIAVWERFEEAEKVTAQEANLIQDVYRLAEGLPVAERQQIRAEARNYVKSVLCEEWPEMARTMKPMSPDNRYVTRLWGQIVRLRADKEHDSNLIYHLQNRFIDMNEMRRLRWVRVKSSLPNLLWNVLLVGGMLTVCFCALFGMDRLSLHSFKTILLTLFISGMLYAIWELDLPFQRKVTVEPIAFEQALDRFDHLDASVDPAR